MLLLLAELGLRFLAVAGGDRDVALRELLTQHGSPGVADRLLGDIPLPLGGEVTVDIVVRLDIIGVLQPLVELAVRLWIQVLVPERRDALEGRPEVGVAVEHPCLDTFGLAR